MARLRRQMSEEQFQAALVQAARMRGFLVHFVPDKLYRRSFKSKAAAASGLHQGPRYAIDLGDPGFPDLVLCRGDGVFYRELKVGYNTLTDNQEVWRDRLLAAGQDWELWHGDDYDQILALINAA